MKQDTTDKNTLVFEADVYFEDTEVVSGETPRLKKFSLERFIESDLDFLEELFPQVWACVTKDMSKEDRPDPIEFPPGEYYKFKVRTTVGVELTPVEKVSVSGPWGPTVVKEKL